METKLEYLIKRLKESVGEQTLTSIIEQLYNLVIIQKQQPSSIIKRLKNRSGRRSKIEKYLNLKNHREALNLLNKELKEGRISKRTYYRVKKRLLNDF